MAERVRETSANVKLSLNSVIDDMAENYQYATFFKTFDCQDYLCMLIFNFMCYLKMVFLLMHTQF